MIQNNKKKMRKLEYNKKKIEELIYLIEIKTMIMK